MLRPPREKPTTNSFTKFVRYFGLLMTLLYVGLGIFLIFAGDEYLNLNMSREIRIIFGGVLILYGLLRFVRIIRKNARPDHD